MEEEDHEVVQYGPFVLERKGRLVSISSNWDPEEHARFKEDAIKHRPELEKEIHADIDKIKKLLNDFNCLDILSAIASIYFFGINSPPEKPDSILETHLEFIVDLALTNSVFTEDSYPEADIIQEINDVVLSIFQKIIWFYIYESMEGKLTHFEHELRFKSIIRSLASKSDSYEQHYKTTWLELFEPHNDFLESAYGFKIDDALKLYNGVSQQSQNNINSYIAGFSTEFDDLRKTFIKMIESGEIKFASEANASERFREQEGIQDRIGQLFKEFATCGGKDVYKIDMSDYNVNFVNLISCKFGESSDYSWPLDDSLIATKPIILHDDTCYCFTPGIIIRNLKLILEKAISEKDERYYHETYLPARAKYLEQSTIGLFKKMFTTKHIFENLFYIVEENGEEKRCELDGLVTYDNHLFLIEARSKHLAPSALRGGYDRLEDNLMGIVNKAYEQAKRARNYIIESEIPVFTDKKGKKIVRINKEKIKKYYLVNVSLESLHQYATHLNSLETFGFVKDQDFPWSVHINDLRVISEILDFPSQFIDYIQRRIDVNDYPNVVAMDELDFFGWYLMDEFIVNDVPTMDFHRFQVGDYTEDLNGYYIFDDPKPSHQIPDKFKEIIEIIEKYPCEDYTDMSLFLLRIAKDSKLDLVDSIEACIESVRTGKSGSCRTLYSKDQDFCICLMAGKKSRPILKKKLLEYCILRKHVLKKETCIGIARDINDPDYFVNDFVMVSNPWEGNEDLDKAFKDRYKSGELIELNK